MIINILGHNIVFGIGAGIEKEDEGVAEPHVTELQSSTVMPIGFRANEEWEDDDE